MIVAEPAVIITRKMPVATATAVFMSREIIMMRKKAPGVTPTVATKKAEIIEMRASLVIY